MIPAATAKRPVIGITLGDAAGIGPEVGIAAVASGEADPAFTYRLIGITPPDVVPGVPTPETARAAWDALEEAARLAMAGDLAAVVTGPVCKASMYAAGFPYPGQTEFFAARCQVENFAMLLTGGKLTVALVSTHLPLASAVAQLATSEIVRVGCLLANYLRLARPDGAGRAWRVAVAGLNPHAGEDGTLGREEIERIAPAVSELQTIHAGSGVTFNGPVPPDTVFHQAAQGQWDAVLCMYHDQGLIPLKLHAFDTGVNVTLGLPIIRTSPDHGTAFAIAGQDKAHAGSMIAAIRLAQRLVTARQDKNSAAHLA